MHIPDERLAALVRGWLPGCRWFAGKGADLGAVEVLARNRLAVGEQLIVGVQVAGEQQVYQVPVLIADRRLAGLIGSDGRHFVHDGLLHADVVRGLLEPTHWRAAVPELREYRVLTGEQSNTSAVFDEAALVKFFRRLAPGVNPDIEVHEALSAVGCPCVAELLGSVPGAWGDAQGHTAMVQRFISGSTDGWDLSRDPERLFSLSAELGAAVARVHADLRLAYGVRTVPAPEIAARLQDRLTAFADVVPEVGDLAPRLRPLLRAVADLPAQSVQRVHGDLHLGQTLHGEGRWFVIDFEGEPGGAGPVDVDHPVRDVAAMARSYDYAARVRGDPAISRACEAFLRGYGDGLDGVLLRAFLVDKAAYEAVYEHRNRPDWVGIPLIALRRLAGDQR